MQHQGECRYSKTTTSQGRIYGRFLDSYPPEMNLFQFYKLYVTIIPKLIEKPPRSNPNLFLNTSPRCKQFNSPDTSAYLTRDSVMLTTNYQLYLNL